MSELNMPVYPEKSLAADLIENQPDTKAARLPVIRDNLQNPDTAVYTPEANTRPSLDAGPAGIVPKSPVDIVPAGPNDVVSTDPPVDIIMDITPEPGGSSRKKRPLAPILCVAAAVLILVGSLSIWYHFKTYKHAVGFAESGLALKAADDTIFLPFLTNFHDPEFLTYLEGCVALGEENYDRCREILQPLADAGYRDSDEVICLANYREACDVLDQGNFLQAIQLLKPLADQRYQDSLELYSKARLAYGKRCLLDIDDFSDIQTGYAYIAGAARDGYGPAQSALENARSDIYNYAVNLYGLNNLAMAADYFALLEDYAQAPEYLTLCNTYWGTTTIGELWALRGFANADELILDQHYLCEFLLGSWHNSNHYYYFNMEGQTGQYAYYCTYNIPWQYTGDFEIVDGVYRVFHNGGNVSLNEFKITIVSWNQISVYCYKNGSTYTLYRQ